MATATLEQTQSSETVTETVKAPLRDENGARIVDGVKVQISYENSQVSPVSDNEIRAYIARGNSSHKNTTVTGLNLKVEAEDIDITYEFAPVDFDRIRRITGYLVGTMDRWNDAKQAEEHDRVKHSVKMVDACPCN